ncbi:MAG TPA: ABC transporter substrate-binding protein, partial [Polyangiaceae bacterium]
MRILRRTLIVGLCALALSTVGCKKKATDSSSAADSANATEIVIGHYASMTGSTAHFGQDTDRGVRMAFEEANAKGGVLGKKLRLVTLDDRGDAAEAVNAVNRLIDVEKV